MLQAARSEKTAILTFSVRKNRKSHTDYVFEKTDQRID